MNDTAAVANGLIGPNGDEKSAEKGRPMLLAALILVFGLGASAWLYVEVGQKLPGGGGTSRGFGPHMQAQDVLNIAVGTSALATLLMAGILFGSTVWRRKVAREFTQREEDRRKQSTGLQMQIVESRKSEAMLQNSYNELEQRLKMAE
jgi:Na+/glutamate symporter